MDQYEIVLQLLREQDTLTQEQAAKYGVYHFRQRIHYLRTLGHKIDHVGYREYKLTDYGKALYQEP